LIIDDTEFPKAGKKMESMKSAYSYTDGMRQHLSCKNEEDFRVFCFFRLFRSCVSE